MELESILNLLVDCKFFGGRRFSSADAAGVCVRACVRVYVLLSLSRTFAGPADDLRTLSGPRAHVTLSSSRTFDGPANDSRSLNGPADPGALETLNGLMDIGDLALKDLGWSGELGTFYLEDLRWSGAGLEDPEWPFRPRRPGGR